MVALLNINRHMICKSYMDIVISISIQKIFSKCIFILCQTRMCICLAPVTNRFYFESLITDKHESVYFLKEAVGCSVYTLNHTVFWLDCGLVCWPWQINFDWCIGTKAKLLILFRKSNMSFATISYIQGSSYGISGMVSWRKFISDVCQWYSRNSVSLYVTIWRVTEFFHDHHFTKK